MKRTLFAAIFFGLLLATWQALVSFKVWSPVLVPSPLSVASYLKEAALDGTLASSSIVTMYSATHTPITPYARSNDPNHFWSVGP